jgi:hypothetical protein
MTEGREQKPSRVMTGAAVLGGAAGLAVFGPVGAVAGAGALAYAATRNSKLGDVAKTGEKAVCTGQERAGNCDGASRGEEKDNGKDNGEDDGDDSSEISVRQKLF